VLVLALLPPSSTLQEGLLGGLLVAAVVLVVLDVCGLP